MVFPASRKVNKVYAQGSRVKVYEIEKGLPVFL